MTEISRVSGQPIDWGKKPNPRWISQNQPKAPDAKPAEQGQDKKTMPPYQLKLGKKPNLDNGGKNLEYWSDLRSCILEQEQYKEDNLVEKLRNADLRDKYDVLITCTFDSQTPWPPKEKLPPNFDPKKIMDIRKNPGLGVRDLHKQGIAGKGVKVAIIDMPLLQGHKEYGDKLVKYVEVGSTEEEIKNGLWDAQMHGPAVSSVFVGDDTGVAPEASLYYWAIIPRRAKTSSERSSNFTADIIKGIRQIIDYNKENPNSPIRIVSISSGCRHNSEKREEWDKVKKDAKENGIIIVSCSYEDHFYATAQCSLDKGRENPNNYDVSYSDKDVPMEKLVKRSESNLFNMYVPTDNRTYACINNKESYVSEGDGGYSWGAPYLSGVMALGLQIDPTLDEDTIYKYLKDKETSTPFIKKIDGKKYNLGWIVNPKGFTDKVFLELGRKIDPELTMEDALKYIEETKMFVKNDNRLVINPKGFVDRVKLELEKNRTNKTK